MLYSLRRSIPMYCLYRYVKNLCCAKIKVGTTKTIPSIITSEPYVSKYLTSFVVFKSIVMDTISGEDVLYPLRHKHREVHREGPHREVHTKL